jgi:hypothetical protein
VEVAKQSHCRQRERCQITAIISNTPWESGAVERTDVIDDFEIEERMSSHTIQKKLDLKLNGAPHSSSCLILVIHFAFPLRLEVISTVELSTENNRCQ